MVVHVTQIRLLGKDQKMVRARFCIKKSPQTVESSLSTFPSSLLHRHSHSHPTDHPLYLSIMNQASRATQKTSNQKSAARNASGEASQHSSCTKENPVNPAMALGPMSSRRRPFREVIIEENNVEDMAQKMLEMQGKPDNG